jgi:hypothetical protein
MKTIIRNAHDFLLSDIDLYKPKIGSLANRESQHLEIEKTLVFLNYKCYMMIKHKKNKCNRMWNASTKQSPGLYENASNLKTPLLYSTW